jgi:hypothetical protein
MSSCTIDRQSRPMKKRAILTRLTAGQGYKLLEEGSVAEYSEHQRIMAAGWAYRMNERGWVIYRDPQTGTWYPRAEAISVVQAQVSGQDGRRPLVATARP